jgi:hypothetical protein
MARKCAKCGVVSEIEDAFQKSFYSDEIFYCPTCLDKNTIRNAESFLIASLILFILGLLLVTITPQNEFARLVLQAGLFMCFIPIIVVLHELGHVIAAVLTKTRIYYVTVGLGEIVRKRNILGVKWIFCKLPVCGATYVGTTNRKFYRTRRVLVTLGGPAMNCVIGIAATITLFGISSPDISATIKPFIAANIFELLHSLIPKKWHISGQPTPSDGLSLLHEPFMSESEIDRDIEGSYAWEVSGCGRTGRIEDAKRIYETGLTQFPDSVSLKTEMARILFQLHNYSDARNILVRLQQSKNLEPAMAVYLLNGIATADVMMGTEQLLDEADDFSRTACEKMPWQAEFKGTRGLVLAKKGQIEQGLALLREAMDTTEPLSHKAAYASYIAEFENIKNNSV